MAYPPWHPGTEPCGFPTARILGMTSPHAEARADGGMVATPHRLASEAGADALRRGGNASAAGVAAAATIAVVYPHMNSIGGDSFWLLYDAGGARVRALNAAGRSAAAATLETYRARFGDTMPVRGGMAALMVPGAVSGWWEAHRYSRATMGSPLAFRELLAHAIAHARDGIAPSASQRRITAQASALFAADAPPEVRATFWPHFHPERLRAERFVQTALAETLTRVAEGGADEFYRGALAKRIAE